MSITRCPQCTVNLDGHHHDIDECTLRGEAIRAAVQAAKEHGLPTDRAARIAGSLSAEILPKHLRSVAVAAVTEWAASVAHHGLPEDGPHTIEEETP